MEHLLKKCDEISQLFKSLSHPVRLKILCQLMDGDKTVNELTDFCKISQSAMSQFLKRMKSEGVLSSRREKNYIYYAMSDKKLMKLLGVVKKLY